MLTSLPFATATAQTFQSGMVGYSHVRPVVQRSLRCGDNGDLGVLYCAYMTSTGAPHPIYFVCSGIEALPTVL